MMAQSVATFLSMGGYGGFVWPAYGLSAVVMVVLLVVTLKSLRQRERELKILQGSAANRERRRRHSGDRQ